MTEPTKSSLDNLLLRQIAIGVVLQGLLDTMIAKDILTPNDIVAIRRYAMDLSRDMLDVADAQTRAAGVRIGEEVEAFLRVVVGLPTDLDEDESLLWERCRMLKTGGGHPLLPDRQILNEQLDIPIWDRKPVYVVEAFTRSMHLDLPLTQGAIWHALHPASYPEWSHLYGNGKTNIGGGGSRDQKAGRTRQQDQRRLD